MPNRSRVGFSLIELMIGVVIAGILASLAIPIFGGYVYRNRVNEAVSMLNEIKARQEAYRSQYGQYAAVNGADWGASYNPPTVPGAQAVPWPSTADWEALGVVPPGPVRFRYATIAGPPGVNPPASTNMRNDEHWYAAQAEGDLDGDNDTFILEVYSQSTRMWNSAGETGGWK